jgi:3-methyl-2-oxobutanoate hydroxymethyltransferase
VLVYHDLLGMMSHPHHAKVTPKFCKRYAEVGQVIQSALAQYRQDVEEGTFPGQQYSPYSIPVDEVDQLVQQLRESGMQAEADAVAHTTVGVRQPPQQQAQQQQQHAKQQQHTQDPAAAVTPGGSTARVP